MKTTSRDEYLKKYRLENKIRINRYNRKYRKLNAEKLLIYERTRDRKEYYKLWRKLNPNYKRKLVTKEYRKEYYKRNAHKTIARRDVYLAVKNGRLKKPLICTDCKELKPLEGHHEDYSKPLEVIWLCKPCHRKADAKIRQQNTPVI